MKQPEDNESIQLASYSISRIQWRHVAAAAAAAINIEKWREEEKISVSAERKWRDYRPANGLAGGNLAHISANSMK